ncbi:polyprenyl synthetase family protein [Crossiella sp. CA-258035]|uniref:polyprenyl synthetase family protein n=1 Tax=Crossiella sp. CA-258035 TaxID=2981138 RepID=UPI0024BC2A83|nr:polyprenyl synthetase family protein [Crossiella sp. CA-258035]WHT21275.1 polyprenyl synthetase family protein [Crossiella sp. CA-258035]
MPPPQLLRHPIDIDLTAHVHEALREFLEERRREIDAIDETVAAAMDSLTSFILDGGKRIRPTFAWWGWRAGGGRPESPDAPEVLRAVSSLELIQACALVHDDLMDSSDRRRGQPTLHVRFAMQHHAAGWAGTPDAFGLSAAILLGDLALAWADDLLYDAALDQAALARARPVWRSMRTEVLVGQYLDVLAQARAANEPETAMRINRYKTAAYTVERPLHLGAALAGGSPELIAGLRAFGTDLGIGFQLRDDLLGVFGDPKVTGKPAGDDLREGKRTLLVTLGLQRAEELGDRPALVALQAAIGNPELDEAGVDRTRELLHRLGAVEAVEQRITAHTEAALSALATAPMAEEQARGKLAELAIEATRRDH